MFVEYLHFLRVNKQYITKTICKFYLLIKDFIYQPFYEIYCKIVTLNMIVIVLELHRCLKAKLIIGNIRNQPIKYPPLTTNKTN